MPTATTATAIDVGLTEVETAPAPPRETYPVASGTRTTAKTFFSSLIKPSLDVVAGMCDWTDGNLSARHGT
jgi:hypothetical protein